LKEQLLVPNADADDDYETDASSHNEDRCEDDDVDGGHGDPPYLLASGLVIPLP